MTHQELKDKLITRIRETDNQELLEDLFRLIESGDTDSGYYDLSPQQLHTVEESMDFKKIYLNKNNSY